MPPAIDKDAKIPCPTPQHLQGELDALTSALELQEKEDTWEKMERAILRFAAVTRGGGYKHLPLYVEGIGKMGCGLKIGACMLSDRGRLSGVATDLLQTLAPRLGTSFAPLISVYLPPLVHLLGRPNKVFLKRAEKCLHTIIIHCPLQPILADLRRGLADEAATCRRGCATAFERAMLDWEKGYFGDKGVSLVEEAIRRAGTDKDPEVRAIGKRIWARYGEIWPERVDEFSDPLTPTIRRYLGVGAAVRPVAGPSKSRLAKPPAPRPVPIASDTLSASLPPSTSAIAALEVAAAPRVHALGGKAVRPPAAPVQASVLEPAPRSRPSPIKQPAPAVPPSASTSTFPVSHHSTVPAALPSEPSRTRVASRAPRYPPNVLGLQSRSISHSVLPINTNPPSSFPSPTQTAFPFPTHSALETHGQTAASYPLSHPSRPPLPSSTSTVSLPGEVTDQWAPVRRLAPPARPVRPATEELGDLIDLGASRGAAPNPITPHILRGAVRPVQPAGGAAAGIGGRRGLGQAQRRVVTAPTPALPPPPEIEYTPVPRPMLKSNVSAGVSGTGGVRGMIEDMERRQREVEAAAGIPLPTSPAVQRHFASPSRSPGAINAAKAEQEERSGSQTPTARRRNRTEVQQSPLMPILARSTNRPPEQERGQDGKDEVDLLGMEIPDDFGDMTLGRTETPDITPESRGGVERESEAAAHDAALVPVENHDDEPAMRQIPAGATSQASSLDTPLVTPLETESPDAPLEKDLQAARTKSSATEPTGGNHRAKAAIAESESKVLKETKARKPGLPPIAPRAKPTQRIASATTATSTTSASNAKLPPVTAGGAAKARIPSAEARKPFRPTVKAATSAAPATALSASAPAAVSKPVPTAVTKEVAPPGGRVGAKPAMHATTASIATSASSRAVSNAPTKTTEVKPPGGAKDAGSRLTKPTAASAHRAATAAVPAVRASKPPITTAAAGGSGGNSAHAVLPPVRIVKEKRKAAVPSFRPVRNNALTAAGTTKATGGASLSASTASSSASAAPLATSKPKAKPPGAIVARVKVRPEALPLPASPGEARPTHIPLPPSPVKEEFVGRVKVKPAALELSASMRRSGTASSAASSPSVISGDHRSQASESATPKKDGVDIPGPESAGMGSTGDASPHSLAKSDDVHLEATLDENATPPREMHKLDNFGLPLPPHKEDTARTPYSKASTAPVADDWLGSDQSEGEGEEEVEEVEEVDEVELARRRERGRMIFKRGGKAGRTEDSGDFLIHPSTNLRDVDSVEERDLIEFSAPSGRSRAEGAENVVPSLGEVVGYTVEKQSSHGGHATGKTPPGSPRTALSERDRNGAGAVTLTA